MPYYHVAPERARRSITAHGIDPRRFASVAPPGFERHQPEDQRGCFLFDDLDIACWYADYMARQEPAEAMDIWEVEPLGALWPDPGLIVGIDDAENEPGSWFHIGVARALHRVR